MQLSFIFPDIWDLYGRLMNEWMNVWCDFLLRRQQLARAGEIQSRVRFLSRMVVSADIGTYQSELTENHGARNNNKKRNNPFLFFNYLSLLLLFCLSQLSQTTTKSFIIAAWDNHRGMSYDLPRQNKSTLIILIGCNRREAFVYARMWCSSWNVITAGEILLGAFPINIDIQE